MTILSSSRSEINNLYLLDVAKAAYEAEERAAPVKARTMIDLTDKLYKRHGWQRAKGESKIKRCKTLYIITFSSDAEWLIATPRK